MGCSQILTVVNSAIIIMDMQVFLLCDGFDSFGYIPKSGEAGSYGNSIL